MSTRLATGCAVVFLMFAIADTGSAQQESRQASAVTGGTDPQLAQLESQVAQLQRELRARRLRDVQDAEAGRESYQDTRDRILKLQNFVNRYALFE